MASDSDDTKGPTLLEALLVSQHSKSQRKNLYWDCTGMTRRFWMLLWFIVLLSGLGSLFRYFRWSISTPKRFFRYCYINPLTVKRQTKAIESPNHLLLLNESCYIQGSVFHLVYMKRPRPETKEGRGEGSAAVTSSSSSSITAPSSSSKYNYAVVCSSNINRSMEAHVAFFNHRLKVGSYGAGRYVRLPVPGGPGEGRSFEFGTSYEKMLAELSADTKAQEFYKKTKLLDILRRNKQIKTAPERWQDTSSEVVSDYDVVLCFEQRIFDAVIEDLQSREPKDLDPICVICMETKDDPNQAVIAGRAAVKLAQKLEESDDLASEAPEMVEAFTNSADGRRLLFQICYL